MNPLVVGGAIAAVVAGPPLYSLVENGQMDGSSAILRGLLVAALCAVAVTYILQLMAQYQHEWEAKNQRRGLLNAIAEAEEAAKRQADAVALNQAAQAQAQNSGQKSGSDPRKHS